MIEELLIPCASCSADIGVILGTGSRDELAGLCCWRCQAGLPPLPPPELSPTPIPHRCPPTSLRIYRAGWKCNDCGRMFAASDVAS